MASESQQKREVLAAVRRAKNLERSLDTALEKLERELIRLRKRKTRIQPDDLNTMVRLYDQGVKPRFFEMEHALADVVSIASY